jgi:hypothetical protein
MAAIIIVQFESPHLLARQLPAIARYIHGAQVYVYDNSRIHSNKVRNQAHCDSYGAHYRSVTSDEKDFSMNHSRALNYAFIDLRHGHDVLLFLDHDMFPIRETDILQQAEQHAFIGFKQCIKGTTYLHPALLAINTRRINYVDFAPCDGLDTGGRIAPLITDENTAYISYAKNEDLGYEILNGTFMHFVKGSNWTGASGHNERLKVLFDELDKISDV